MSRRYRHKYGAIPVEVNGIKFHSQGEAAEDSNLVYLEMAGEISNLVRQPKFTLQPAFVHEGKKVAAITYTADWSYTENGRTVIADFKGIETDVFKMKWKMMKYLYPDFIYRITTK